jgi:hypothetical protein
MRIGKFLQIKWNHNEIIIQVHAKKDELLLTQKIKWIFPLPSGRFFLK